MSVLIFAEKPSQGRDYANVFTIRRRHQSHIELEKCSIFPNGAIITWGIGHLVSLLMPYEYDEKYKRWSLDQLPIVPDRFKYKINKQTKEHYQKVKKLMKQASEIIIGTDIDREGELIARLVIQQAGMEHKITKRLWANSTLEEEIRRAFNNLRPASETYNLYVEAQTRQQADWLVGMNLSPLYTLSLQQKGFQGSLSIGRVQTPTVMIAYKRQKEIENFVSKPYYQLKANFLTNNNESYEGVADLRIESKEEMKEFINKNHLTKQSTGIVRSVTKKERRNFPPRLHSITSLQSKVNKLFKYSSDNVLKTVQSLYEKKLVSYPRTDCRYIGEKEYAYLLNNVEGYKRVAGVNFETASAKPNKRYVDNEKVTEHYAIIPTQKIPNKQELNKLSEMEKNVYQEILRTTLGIFHRNYLYEETTIFTDVNGVKFKTTGRVEKDKGWREISLEKRNRRDKILPNITKGEEVSSLLEVDERWTSPPKPYTEGQLITAMETAGKLVESENGEKLEEIEGIGTGATRAGIIERIKEHGYIEIKRNTVHVTEKGKLLCEAVKGTLLASPTMTAKWETYLSKIGKGSGTQDNFLRNVINFIEHQLQKVPKSINENITNLVQEDNVSQSIAKCPSCQNFIVDRGKFYGCNGYSSGCKVTFPKKLAGKNLTKNMVKTLCEKGKTNKLKGFRSRKGNTFSTKLSLDEQFNIKFVFD